MIFVFWAKFGYFSILKPDVRVGYCQMIAAHILFLFIFSKSCNSFAANQLIMLGFGEGKYE